MGNTPPNNNHYHKNGNFGTNGKCHYSTPINTNGFPNTNVHVDGTDQYNNGVNGHHDEDTSCYRTPINYNLGDVIENGLYILLTTC